MPHIANRNDYETLARAAIEAFERHDDTRALEQFRDLERVNETNPVIHEVLCILALRRDDHGEAGRHYQRYLELLQENWPGLKSPPDFESLVASRPPLAEIQADFARILGGNRADPVKSGGLAVDLCLHYMAKGDFQKALDTVERCRDRLLSAHTPG